jgi:predicted permease
MGIWIFENKITPIEHEVMYKIINGVIIILLYFVVLINLYRLYRYTRFLKNNKFDQYGNIKTQWNIDKNSDLSLYRNLSTRSE